MENKVNLTAKPIDREPDLIANILKWILLITAFVCFAVVAWGTYRTYQEAPPLPKQFITATGQMVMVQQDIIAGKASFQQADLMDYGSIYGMGSYFGEDYTAQYLVRLGQVVNDILAEQQFGKPFAQITEAEQYSVRKTMQSALQQVDLSQEQVILPSAMALAIQQIRGEISHALLNNDFAIGWTKGL